MKKLLFIFLLLIHYPSFSNQDINFYLENAKIAQGISEISQQENLTDSLYFQLGILQFFKAVENLEQAWYNYGLYHTISIPFLRLPTLHNPHPKKLSYQDFREVFDAIQQDLMIAEASLAQVKADDIILPIYFGKAYLDIDKNNIKSSEESLSYIYKTISNANFSSQQAQEFVIHLDKGDIYWLRAYMHLLSGLVEFFLAYDHEKLFHHSAFQIFPNIETPYKYLKKSENFSINVIDNIAFIHLLNFPLKQPYRTQTALQHFETTIQLSKIAWQYYQQETDDNYEWIPNAQQTGVIPNIKITQEMIDSWLLLLDEVELLLKGEKLIRYWWVNTDDALNIRTIFLNPQPFDLVLWVQGSAIFPYLEKITNETQITPASFWGTINQVFNGRLIGFAIWFN